MCINFEEDIRKAVLEFKEEYEEWKERREWGGDFFVYFLFVYNEWRETWWIDYKLCSFWLYFGQDITLSFYLSFLISKLHLVGGLQGGVTVVSTCLSYQGRTFDGHIPTKREWTYHIYAGEQHTKHIPKIKQPPTPTIITMGRSWG